MEFRSDKKRIFLAACLLGLGVFLVSSGSRALAAPSEQEQTAKIIAGAKQEKKLSWYTTLTSGEGDALAKKFREKYPFLEVETYRAGSEKIMTKILGEVQAKKYLFDVVMLTGAEGEILKRKKIFMKYSSPQAAFFPEGFKDPEGYWTDLYVNLNTIGYNTIQVRPGDVPRSYEDLLNPRWKGRMGMDTKAFEWFANMLKIMGEKKGLEYMKKLAAQNLQFRTGRTLNAQMVAAGEISLSITCYNQRIEEMKGKGAPVDWIAFEPVIPEIHPVGIFAYAPHPNAARLFIDFLLSREGQEVIAGLYRIPSRSDVDPLVPKLKKGLKIKKPDLTLVDNYEKYTRLFRETLMKR